MIPRDPPTHCSHPQSGPPPIVSEGSSSPWQEGFPSYGCVPGQVSQTAGVDARKEPGSMCE